MTKLPKNEAEELFKHFSPFRFGYDFDDTDCYKPLWEIIKNKETDESFKERAKDQVNSNLSLILRKTDNASDLSGYIDIAGWYMRDPDVIKPEQEDYEYTIGKLLDIAKPGPLSLRTGPTYKDIKDTDLRHRFIRRQIFDDEGNVLPKSKIKFDIDHNFWLYDEYHNGEDDYFYFIAKQAISDYPEDQDLVDFMTKEIKEYEIAKDKYYKDKEKENNRNNALKSQMKRPIASRLLRR